MNTVEVRTIQNDGERQEAFFICEEVFPENHSFFQERFSLDGNDRSETTWIAKVNGEMAATAQVFPYYFQYGKVSFKVGGLANVATLPKFRGRNLAQIIIRQQIKWMEANDFDLSLLSTGINAFYEPLGWHTLPHQSYILENIYELPENFYDVAEYRASDLEEVKGLYEQFRRQVVGIYERTDHYWHKQLQRTYNRPAYFLVARKQEEMVAYIRYDLHEDQAVLIESSYIHGHEGSLTDLLRAIQGKHENINSFHLRFAGNHFLRHFFMDAGATEMTGENYMWKLINQDKVIQQLQATFAANISVPEINILLQCGKADYLLRKKGEKIEINQPTDPMTYDQLIKCSEGEFLSLFLKGAHSVPHVNGGQQLFPTKDRYCFWHTDSF